MWIGSFSAQQRRMIEQLVWCKLYNSQARTLKH